ncbi:peptide-N(4)-(N-acetyl-beta-glucosaminyl)asparagine amidase-like [Oncorhynchus masou masou]|uniref:peptide-N(4)-(N-acetyl-beta- glucosaminyl)asparagine amidase-like n=1 Tax=Oncorhynchus masou masou TaxID=90313 RepID=UPI00318309BF
MSFHFIVASHPRKPNKVPSKGQLKRQGTGPGTAPLAAAAEVVFVPTKKVYLARTEGSSSGNISWKLDCAPVGMKIKTVSVRRCSQTFHSGTGR